MNVYKHTAVSFVISALLLLALKKIQVSIACFLTGVFIDVDHVFDYYVNGDLKPRLSLLRHPRKLFSSLSADYARYKPDYSLYKIFHSVEILIVVPFLYFFGLWNAIATGIVIGFITHMIMDALPVGHIGMLSLSYKIRNGFPISVNVLKQRLSRTGRDVEKCQLCGAGGETIPYKHGSTYMGFTTKALDKLMILCPDCRERVHDEENQKAEEPESREAETDEHEKRNFRLFLINGVFTRIGFRLVDSSMVLAAFVKELTGSNVLVGLTSSTVRAGWMWPQLLVSNLLEHRPRKMPFYIFGVTARVISWIFILALTLSIGDGNYLLLFICFYALYFAAGSALGISTLPYNDIVAKSIPVERRARLFSLRQLIGGMFGIGVGVLIRHILKEGFFLSFPDNYAFIFGLATLMMIGGSVAFVLVKEPIRPVHNERRPFWQHLKRGAHFLKVDRDYRYFMIFRIASTFGSMCTPFYVPYALDSVGLGVPESTIGSFIAIGSISGVLSNILWGYMGERYGSKSLLVASSCLACITPIIAASARYLPAQHQVAFYFLVFIASQAFMSGSMIAYMTYTLNLAPSKSRPTYLGFLNTLMFPMSFVPVLAGVLLKVMAYESMFLLSAGMAALAIYFASNLTNVDKRGDVEPKDD